MKQSIILSTVIVAVAAFFSFSSAAFAQSQNFDVQTSLPSQVSSNNAGVMSPSQVEKMTHTAISLTLRAQSSQFTAIASRMMLPTAVSSLKAIENGGSQTYSAVVGTKSSQTIVSQNKLQVNVSYEPRPIGGILNIKVELVPQFAGVGVATRAIASKTIATAVDGLNVANVNQLVGSLSADLASDIAGSKLN